MRRVLCIPLPIRVYLDRAQARHRQACVYGSYPITLPPQKGWCWPSRSTTPPCAMESQKVPVSCCAITPTKDVLGSRADADSTTIVAELAGTPGRRCSLSCGPGNFRKNPNQFPSHSGDLKLLREMNGTTRSSASPFHGGLVTPLVSSCPTRTRRGTASGWGRGREPRLSRH